LSPPIIEAISDASHSLQTGLQLTWLALLLAGACWLAGALLLSPVESLGTISAFSPQSEGVITDLPGGTSRGGARGGGLAEQDAVAEERAAEEGEKQQQAVDNRTSSSSFNSSKVSYFTILLGSD
jgi:hypothetical protein